MALRSHLLFMIKHSELGATAIEYALILLLVAIVTIAAQRSIGTNAFNAIQSSSNLIDQASEPLKR